MVENFVRTLFLKISFDKIAYSLKILKNIAGCCNNNDPAPNIIYLYLTGVCVHKALSSFTACTVCFFRRLFQ